jgi:hypothetical protein
MQEALNSRSVRSVLFAAGSLMLAGLGCGAPPAPGGPELVAKSTVRQAPPRPTAIPVHRLIATAVNTAPRISAAPLAGAMVDARVLVITGDGTDSDFGAIQSTLQFLGTPFDVLNASTGPALTADMLATGTHGKYNAVFLDTGNLSVTGGSAFTADEWNTLTTYEAQFGVRRVSLYTSPTAAYGLSDNGEKDPSKTPVTMTCTAAGAALFAGANCANPIVVNQGWVYPAAAVDAATAPLLVDASGNVYAATRSYPDGREALALTYAQASYFNPYLELAYGLVKWATRGVFIGERHVYAVPQLDDLFLASDIFTGGTYRITDSDLQALADWQAAKRANPLFAGFRLAWAANGYGSQTKPGDPLTAKAIALGSTFAWINHTWDHPVLDGLTYADALTEFRKNDAYLKGLPLTPYATVSVVTPNISGLASADAMQAMHDAGIKYCVSDTSIPQEKNPSPNIGIWNALQPSILEIPRIPGGIGYNVSQPAEWIAEWEHDRMVSTVDYPTMIAVESDNLAGYMLAGNKDPWMYHQANTRNYDQAGHSVLSDLLDAALAKYAAASTFPLQSPTEDELGQIFINRMTLQNAGATATIQPGTSITVSVTSAATVPVTGLCTPGAETYGGQTISYLSLAAGQSVTLSLVGCNAGAGGAGGSAGSGGFAGSSGAAGAPGTAGTSGTSGTAGTAGTSGMAGAGGAGGAMNMGGTSGTAGAGGAAGAPASGGMSGTGSAGSTGAAGATPTGGASGVGGGVVSGVGGAAGTLGAGGAGGGGGSGPGAAGAGGSGGAAGAIAAGGAAGNGHAGAGGVAAGIGGRGGSGGAAAGGHAGGVMAAGGHGGLGGGGGHPAGGRGQAGSGQVSSGSSGCDCAVADASGGSGALFLTLMGAALGTTARRRRRS